MRLKKTNQKARRNKNNKKIRTYRTIQAACRLQLDKDQDNPGCLAAAGTSKR